MHQGPTWDLVRRLVVFGGAVSLGASITKAPADNLASSFPSTRPGTNTEAAPMVMPAPATSALMSTRTAVDVNQLINQLGGDSLHERDSAQRHLVDAGRAAMPALKKAAESSTDPEIRNRAAAALAELKEHADSDVSLISTHLRDAPTKDVLDAISSQSYTRIVDVATAQVGDPGTRRVSLDADKEPFWNVMSEVCGQLNVCAVPVGPAGQGELRLMSIGRNWMQAPHDIVGPFWIGVSGVSRSRTIDLIGTPNIDDQFVVRLFVVPEPKLALSQMSDFIVKEATDTAGHSLLPKDVPGKAFHSLGRAGAIQPNRQIEARLTYPEQPGTRIMVLRGEVDVTIARDVQQYIVKDLTGAQKVVSPLRNCRVNVSVTKEEAADTYRVTLQCTRMGVGDEQWAAMVSGMDEMTLQDRTGQKLTCVSNAAGGTSTPTTFTASGFFSRNPKAAALLAKVDEPERLTWNVATSLKPIRIPVTFKDLPMP